MALDPLNRRATRRTFISRASKGARRVAAERERRKRRGRKREDEEKGVGGKGEEGRTEGPATMRHMARARPEQHAMQFSCRLHHQSVLARSRVHRARELPGRLSLSLFLSSPSVTCAPRIAAPLRSKMRPVPSSSCLSCFPFPPPCFAPSISVIRVIGRGFSGIKLQRRKKKKK